MGSRCMRPAYVVLMAEQLGRGWFEEKTGLLNQHHAGAVDEQKHRQELICCGSISAEQHTGG